MNTTYRRATPDDHRAIADLHAESWRTAYRSWLDDAYLDGPVVDERRAVWEPRMTAPPPNQFVVVAEDGAELVGFACAYGADDEEFGTLLDNLHVRADRHRQGIGRRLMADVVSWCRRAYPECGLYLWVIGANDRARRFYESLGAEDFGGEIRPPAAGGGPARDVRRYGWRVLPDIEG